MSLGAVSDRGARELLDPASPVRRHYEGLAGNLPMEGRGIVVVTSPDPGAGRTSVCLGLGAALAGMGRRAAVVDCNLENSQLHRMLGEPNFVGLTSGLEDSTTLEHHGYEVVPGLLVVHASRTPKDVAREAADDLLAAGVNLLGVVLNGCA